MSHLPILKYREFKKVLTKLGYKVARQKGSHVIFSNEDGQIIIVPKHKGRTLGKGLIRKLINDLEISVEDFIKLVGRK